MYNINRCIVRPHFFFFFTKSLCTTVFLFLLWTSGFSVQDSHLDKFPGNYQVRARRSPYSIVDAYFGKVINRVIGKLNFARARNILWQINAVELLPILFVLCFFILQQDGSVQDVKFLHHSLSWFLITPLTTVSEWISLGLLCALHEMVKPPFFAVLAVGKWRIIGRLLNILKNGR